MVFREKYWFLSNFYPCEIHLAIDGERYHFLNAEAAYQAHKCPERAYEFQELSGKAAKMHGRCVAIRADWEEIKYHVMKKVVFTKFKQNIKLMEKLRVLQGEIVEDNYWGDTFWGVCNGVGENHLGKILMQLRDETL